jgi:hypothetical protein
VEPFDDVDLVSHILRMVPRHWQDQYKLRGATVPQSVRKLLKALECIKKAFPTDKECEGPTANVNGGGSSKKRMVALRDRIPKRSRRDAKHCVLCKQHGGAHNTHNTGECHKYEKDGTPKKAFAGKSVQHNPHNRNVPCEHNTSYAQLSVKIVKLKKSNKKLKRPNEKCKCDCDSDSDDSDSS